MKAINEKINMEWRKAFEWSWRNRISCGKMSNVLDDFVRSGISNWEILLADWKEHSLNIDTVCIRMERVAFAVQLGPNLFVRLDPNSVILYTDILFRYHNRSQRQGRYTDPLHLVSTSRDSPHLATFVSSRFIGHLSLRLSDILDLQYASFVMCPVACWVFPANNDQAGFSQLTITMLRFPSQQRLGRISCLLHS